MVNSKSRAHRNNLNNLADTIETYKQKFYQDMNLFHKPVKVRNRMNQWESTINNFM